MISTDYEREHEIKTEHEKKSGYEKEHEKECETESEQEKENRNLYRQTMNEIHAPEELLERIDSRKETRTIRKLARFGYAAAAAVAIFITSNAITYAATGESWTEKLIIYINGEAYEYDAQYTTDEDGDVRMKIDSVSDDLDVYVDVEVNSENSEVIETLMSEMLTGSNE